MKITNNELWLKYAGVDVKTGLVSDVDTRYECRIFYLASLWMHLMEKELTHGVPLKDAMSSALDEAMIVVDATSSVVAAAFNIIHEVWEYGQEFFNFRKVILSKDLY